MRTRKKYDIVRTVSNLQELNWPGKEGQRVLIKNISKYYYWNKEEVCWKLEAHDYRYYNCQLHQHDTDNPTVNVLGLPTIIGTITWQRTGIGVYVGTSSHENEFLDLKTQFFYAPHEITLDREVVPAEVIVKNLYHVETIFPNEVEVRQFDASTFEPIDGLRFFDLEIRIYETNWYYGVR